MREASSIMLLDGTPGTQLRGSGDPMRLGAADHHIGHRKLVIGHYELENLRDGS